MQRAHGLHSDRKSYYRRDLSSSCGQVLTRTLTSITVLIGFCIGRINFTGSSFANLYLFVNPFFHKRPASFNVFIAFLAVVEYVVSI